MDGRSITQVEHIELTRVILSHSSVSEIDRDGRFITGFADFCDVPDVAVADFIAVFDLHYLVTAAKPSRSVNNLSFVRRRRIDFLPQQLIERIDTGFGFLPIR